MKQIHFCKKLFIKVKDTIFESKSQLETKELTIEERCLSKSKIQFLKANHNLFSGFKRTKKLFIKVKDTIFESKSQLISIINFCIKSCLSKSKIQFLKANHNSPPLYFFCKMLFIKVKDTIFESKSQ